MKTLVTGGAGFIGSNLVDYLVRQRHEVIVFDNLSRKGADKNLQWLQNRYKNDFLFVQGDVRDYSALQSACKGVELVYHLASQVAVTTSLVDPKTDFEVNALGTFNALEAVKKTGSDPIFIFTSTNKVYGGMEDISVLNNKRRYIYQDIFNGIPETRPLNFHSPYGCSKGAADQYVRDYHRIYGLRTVVFRMSCIYGPRQLGNEDQGWVAHFAISTLVGKPVTIYGDGKQTRDILYIQDLINAFELAISNVEITAGKIYNIGGGSTMTVSLLDLITWLEERLGHKIQVSFDKWRLGDQLVYISDISKAKREFGWEPKVSVKEGLDRLLDWTQENQHLFTTV